MPTNDITLTETQAYHHVDAQDNSAGTMRVNRKATNTGGTVGWVNPTILAKTETSPTSKNFEWSILGVLDNKSAAGENVAVYGQGNKDANGPTWAGCFEARDRTNQVAGSGHGLVGIEVDVFANGAGGTTNWPARVGIDIVGGKGVSNGAKAEIDCGIRIAPQGYDNNLAEFRRGILMHGEYNLAGIDVSTASFKNNAPAMKLGAGQAIQFGAASVSYDPNIDAFKVAGHLRTNGRMDVMGHLGLSTSVAKFTPYSGQTPVGFIDIYVDGNPYKMPIYA